MAKWANSLIIGATISMIVPFILDYFDWLHNVYFWPVLSMILVSVGVLIHVIQVILMKKLNTQTVVLLLSIISIIYGFSLVQINVKNAEYLLLIGVLLIVIWLFVPSRKKP